MAGVETGVRLSASLWVPISGVLGSCGLSEREPETGIVENVGEFSVCQCQKDCLQCQLTHHQGVRGSASK